MGTSSDEIKAFIKEQGREFYSYGGLDEALETLNGAMYRRLENDIYFFVYKEEKNRGRVLVIFSYDNNKCCFEEVYECLLSQLKVFSITKIVEEPSEITMLDYFDFHNEGNRRGYQYRAKGAIDECSYELYHCYKDGQFEKNEKWIMFIKKGLSTQVRKIKVLYMMMLLRKSWRI